MPMPRCSVASAIGAASCRVVDRDLRGLLDGVVVRALVDVVIADDIGDEDAVEDALLQRPRQILPVVEILVFPRFVARMRPQARRLMAHAIHIEGVEAYLAGHSNLHI